MDKLIDNLKTYKMLKKLGKLKIEPKIDKDSVLKDVKDLPRLNMKR